MCDRGSFISTSLFSLHGNKTFAIVVDNGMANGLAALLLHIVPHIDIAYRIDYRTL